MISMATTGRQKSTIKNTSTRRYFIKSQACARPHMLGLVSNLANCARENHLSDISCSRHKEISGGRVGICKYHVAVAGSSWQLCLRLDARAKTREVAC
jgi:hypothetical protein